MNTWKTTWKASRALKAYDLAMARAQVYRFAYHEEGTLQDLEKAIDFYGRALTIASRMIPKGSDADDLDSRMRWESRAKTADMALTENQGFLRRDLGLF